MSQDKATKTFSSIFGPLLQELAQAAYQCGRGDARTGKARRPRGLTREAYEGARGKVHGELMNLLSDRDAKTRRMWTLGAQLDKAQEELTLIRKTHAPRTAARKIRT